MKMTRETVTYEHSTLFTPRQTLLRCAAAAIGFSFLFTLAVPVFAAAKSNSKLNVVLIISDDHGWRDSECCGNTDVSTPNLDRLAREGMRFTHAFAASTLCSPSRAVIDTGLMPFRNGGHVFGGHVHPGVKTIAHYFRALGYENITACGPDRQPSAYHPYWDSWVKLAKTDGAAKVRVDQFLHRPQHELYDLTEDPFERENIASCPENAELLKSLQAQLAEWRKKQGDKVPVYLDEQYVAP